MTAARSDLADEWDFEKNGNITPKDITVYSPKKVWWKCARGHSWKTAVVERSWSGTGCPHCVKSRRTSLPEQTLFYYIKQAFPDAVNGDREEIALELDIYIPSLKVAIEYDGRLWHLDEERDVKKNVMCKEKGLFLIRVREIGCAEIKEDDNCKIIDVISGNQNSLVSAINKVANILNVDIDIAIERDIAEILSMIDYATKEDSLARLYPNIALEWHPTKNGRLTPDCISAHSGRAVWWILLHDDPKTGQHVFEWKAPVRERTERGNGCPYLSGHKISPSFNSLLALNPELALEWNYEKNKDLTNKFGVDISIPEKIAANSSQKVWWKCSSCEHEWQADVSNRNRFGSGCPECYRNQRKQNIHLFSDGIETFNSDDSVAS
jgi:protein-arginine kinase activator protein McsA